MADETNWSEVCVRLRARYGWSQLKLAQAVGCSRGAVAQWELRVHQPGGRLAMALHELLLSSEPRRVRANVAVGNVWSDQLPPIWPGDLTSLGGPGVGLHYRPADLTVRAKTWPICIELLWHARLSRWRAVRDAEAAEPFAAPESAPLA